jgi:hypothetical protein
MHFLTRVGQNPTKQRSEVELEMHVLHQAKVLIVAVAFLAGAVCAEESGADSSAAVAALNGEASLDWSYSDGPYATTQSYGVSGVVNVPIWRFVGASASASTYHIRSKADYSALGLGGPFVDSDNDSALGAALFVRHPEIGRVRGGYKEALEANNFVLSGDLEGYLARWTLSAAVERSGVKNVPVFDPYTATVVGEEDFASNTYLAGVSFYPLEELRLDTKARFLPDSTGRIYTIGAEWMPSVLGNRISAALSYARVTGDVIFQTNNTYGVRLTYFFAPRISLLSLDRAYR